jgi:hypothetical protein
MHARPLLRQSALTDYSTCFILPHIHTNRPQEFGKTKIYLPPQDGLEVLSKEVGASGGGGVTGGTCCPAQRARGDACTPARGGAPAPDTRATRSAACTARRPALDGRVHTGGKG